MHTPAGCTATADCCGYLRLVAAIAAGYIISSSVLANFRLPLTWFEQLREAIVC